MNRRNFNIVYQQNFMALGMLALRITGNVEEAEDAVQDACVAVWLKIEQGVEIGDLRRYLYRAVNNHALMKLREHRPLEDVDSLPDMTDAHVEEEIDTAERDARVWRAVDELPARCREAFLMAKRDGLSYAEIAAEMGTSVKTVEHQIAKAMSRLREALTGYNGKPFFLPFL